MELPKPIPEIVYQGYLIKSPPTKIWGGKWRKRWFTLRSGTDLPGQYFLDYFIDEQCRKFKGRINLDECKQVDSGLRFENNKEKYSHMFSVKTPKRVYYLVADSEAEMNKWVEAICQVCALKAYTQDEVHHLSSAFHFETIESPPVSPASTMSNPYIHISECISGRRLDETSSVNSAMGYSHEHYDIPRKLLISPPVSPATTDAESVFTDDEWTSPVPPSGLEGVASTSTGRIVGEFEVESWSVKQRFGKLQIVDSVTSHPLETISPPPRPPKPAHLLSAKYAYSSPDSHDADRSTTSVTPAPLLPSRYRTMDESYDFPRSHQYNSVPERTLVVGPYPRHCYSNAAPGIKDDRVFRYDFPEDEPTSPRSECSGTTSYSNLESPLIHGGTSGSMLLQPPSVRRELKPHRRSSDSTSNISNEHSPGPMIGSAEISPLDASSMNRKFMPVFSKSPVEVPMKLAIPPRGAIKIYPNFHPSSSNASRFRSVSADGDNIREPSETYFHDDTSSVGSASNRNLVVLQYLDLDLKATERIISSLPPALPDTHTTVYKTVDFMKTEAFNRTRRKVEEERKKLFKNEKDS